MKSQNLWTLFSFSSVDKKPNWSLTVQPKVLTKKRIYGQLINYLLCVRGGSRIFSRGGGTDFQKNFQNFDDLFFFRSTKLTFELSQSTVLPLFWQNFLRRRQIFEKNSQKSRFWALFEKFWQKNSVFFGARSPSKVVYIGAKGAFRKILGSVGQKWISEKVSKGGPFGPAGGRIPEEGASAPPPLNPPLLCVFKNLKIKGKRHLERLYNPEHYDG